MSRSKTFLTIAGSIVATSILFTLFRPAPEKPEPLLQVRFGLSDE